MASDSKAPSAAAPTASAPTSAAPQQLSTTGAQVGRDPSRHVSGASVTVSATWAQNAINAYRTSRSQSPLIAVDGRSGPLTVEALRQVSEAVAPDKAAPKNSPDGRSASRVLIPVALEESLSRLPAVQSPRRRAAGSSGPSVAVVDGQQVQVAEEPAEDLIRDNLPLIIGGSAALAAIGVGFIIWRNRSKKRAVAANRRRRSRR